MAKLPKINLARAPTKRADTYTSIKDFCTSYYLLKYDTEL